jgi:hypothetical protein
MLNIPKMLRAHFHILCAHGVVEVKLNCMWHVQKKIGDKIRLLMRHSFFVFLRMSQKISVL